MLYNNSKETGEFFNRLEDDNELMGCGIVELGRLFSECVSIGMITCREQSLQCCFDWKRGASTQDWKSSG